MSLIFKVLALFIGTVLITSCSGNDTSISSRVSATLNIITGIVHSGHADNVAVQGIAVGINGQLTLNAEGALDGVLVRTDERGRFSTALDYNDPSAIVFFARGASETESKPTQVQCKLPLGCVTNLGLIPFGDVYDQKFYYEYSVNEKPDDDPATDDEYLEGDTTLWSAGIEVAAEGQFVSINAITDMAGAYGFSTYVIDRDGAEPCNAETCKANQQASGYFSKYGIMKANTQVSSLVGIPDIISVEPANIVNLDTIAATSSANLQASIRYGALIAALQQIHLAYDNALENKAEPRFRRMLNKQFGQNVGQLYQKGGPEEQVLTLAQWFGTAQAILVQASTHFNNLNAVLPVEVGAAITAFELDINNLVDNKLTAALPTISEDIALSYDNEIDFTKGMLNHLMVVAQEFSTPEYRQEVAAYQKQLLAIGDQVSPAFNAITGSLLDLYGYYLTCSLATCDSANQWHQFNANYDIGKKELTLKYSDDVGDQLVVYQKIVDLHPEDENDSPTKSLTIDLLFEGVVKQGDLTLVTDSSEGEIGEAGLRVTYNAEFSELQADAALAEKNASMPVADQIYPALYEFSFTSLELSYKPEDEADELILIGGFSWLLRGVHDIRDERKKDDKPARYNLNNLSAVMTLEGKDFALSGAEALSDNITVSLVASGYNSSNYYPDTTFPEWRNYFVAAEGHEAGVNSGVDIVETSIINYTFPQLDGDGHRLVGSLVDGIVVANKSVQVEMLKFDYLHSGAAAFIAYPVGEDGRFIGELCQIESKYEALFKAGKFSSVEDGVVVEIFKCLPKSYYTGPAEVNNLVNQMWDFDPQVQNLIKAVNVIGEGVYFADFVTEGVDQESLAAFSISPVRYTGTMAEPAVLGIDNIRMQVRPQLLNANNEVFLPEVAIDLNLSKPTTVSINLGLFIAYNPTEIVNSEAGLPIIAGGESVESYYIAYKTDDNGNEIGEFIINWYGAQLVDGSDGSPYLQTYDPNAPEAKESFLFNAGTDVYYGAENTAAGYKRCGLIRPNKESDQKCDAVAYLTFRGFVTGTIREEREGVYVARYIDGSWQVLGI